MAHPHEYIGTGANPPAGTAGESYEESWQANPFTALTATDGVPGTVLLVPGQASVVEVNNWHRYITDDGVDDNSDPLLPVAGLRHTVQSFTANPQPHVEYGRVSNN